MIKGGYKIVNFNGATLSGTAVTRTDILVLLKESYGKVILLTGIVIGDNAMDDCFSTPLPDGDDGFKLNAYDGYIAVTKTGAVTYSVAAESSIPGLLTDVTKLKSMNGDEYTSLGAIFDKISSIAVNESIIGYAPAGFFQAHFGLYLSATIVATKRSNNDVYIIGWTNGDKYIVKGKMTKSGGGISWDDRYIFEGTAYTQA